MPIQIQPQYKSSLSSLHNKYKLESDLYIGDFEFLKSVVEVSKSSSYLLISDDEVQVGRLLLELKPKSIFQIYRSTELHRIEYSLEQIVLISDKNKKINAIKQEIQNKRKNLEKLNELLNQESEKQIVSLEQSHLEESQKNIKEKSLLHFLDFIQSESVHEDFLNLLIKFLWKDLKKTNRLYQIGFCFKAYSEKSNLFSYDGYTEQSATVSLDLNSEVFVVASQMATLWGRPVGRIMKWPLPEFSRQGHFFIEIIDQQTSLIQLENYIKERLTVLSLYLDRWMIEKEYEVLVDRWHRTFNSFSGFVHVIDEDYHVYQSNYLKSTLSTKNKKCYQVLAERESPCPDCPIKTNKNNDFYLKNKIRVKTYSSEFNYNQKKYYFVIYEDVTQLHFLKSQMIHSEKMSALGRLGNHLAHELNNPLTGIKSYVQALLAEPQSTLSNTIKSDLNEILKATLRSQNIIKNFIDFSHKKESKLEKIIFLEVLNNALTLLKSVLRSHRLFVDIKPIAVMANSQELQQVLFNLIKNSCQAMTKSGSIKIYHEEKNGRHYFNIEDTGPGFSEEILKNRFEPFMTTKKQGEGTGLGLYLSKKLMNNMNADIDISQALPASQNPGAKISLIFEKR